MHNLLLCNKLWTIGKLVLSRPFKLGSVLGRSNESTTTTTRRIKIMIIFNKMQQLQRQLQHQHPISKVACCSNSLLQPNGRNDMWLCRMQREPLKHTGVWPRPEIVTTGEPKGCMIAHINAMHLIVAQGALLVNHDIKRTLLFAATVFYAAVSELFVGLLNRVLSWFLMLGTACITYFSAHHDNDVVSKGRVNFTKLHYEAWSSFEEELHEVESFVEAGSPHFTFFNALLLGNGWEVVPNHLKLGLRWAHIILIAEFLLL
jgi:hypothetical protein